MRKEPPPTAPVTTAVAPAVVDVPPIPSIVLDAKPLASGLFDQIGLPTGGVMSGTSTGPGPGAASALEAGLAWARDVVPDSVQDPAVELVVAFIGLAGQYPHRA